MNELRGDSKKQSGLCNHCLHTCLLLRGVCVDVCIFDIHVLAAMSYLLEAMVFCWCSACPMQIMRQ